MVTMTKGRRGATSDCQTHPALAVVVLHYSHDADHTYTVRSCVIALVCGQAVTTLSCHYTEYIMNTGVMYKIPDTAICMIISKPIN